MTIFRKWLLRQYWVVDLYFMIVLYLKVCSYKWKIALLTYLIPLSKEYKLALPDGNFSITYRLFSSILNIMRNQFCDSEW